MEATDLSSLLSIVVVESLNHVWFLVTPWTAACQIALRYLPKFAQIHVHWVDDAIQPSHHLSPPPPFAFNLSKHQGLFQWASACIKWPRYWSFSCSISFSNEYLGFISFRIDWFDLLVVQGMLKGLLWHRSSKSSTVWCSAFFKVQLTSAHDYWGKKKKKT